MLGQHADALDQQQEQAPDQEQAHNQDLDVNAASKMLHGVGAHVLAPCGHDGVCPMQARVFWPART